MDELIFEWDLVKAKLNYTKHKVTFEEAKIRIISARKADTLEASQYGGR